MIQQWTCHQWYLSTLNFSDYLSPEATSEWVNWLFNVTINDISVIHVTTHIDVQVDWRSWTYGRAPMPPRSYNGHILDLLCSNKYIHRRTKRPFSWKAKREYNFTNSGAAVTEWLSSWLVEQEVRESIPRLATWISEIGYLPLPSRDMAEIPLKRRKSSIPPTNQKLIDDKYYR